MDPVNGEPFLEHEKRWMLAEALKVSQVPVEKLLNLLHEGGGSPDWDHMLLPRGRTLSQCKQAYDLLRFGPPRPHLSPIGHSFPAPIQQQQQQQQQPQPFQHPPQHAPQKRKSDSAILGHPYMSGEPPGKRRQSGLDVGGTRNIQIQPKPPNNGDPLGPTIPTVAAPPPKKRGRPPKMEVERRQRDAIQRGEVFPVGVSPARELAATSPYAAIAPTPSSLPGPPTPQGIVEQNLPDDQVEGSPGKRKRPKAAAKPTRASAPKQPGESSFSVNPQIPRVREPQVLQQAPSIPSISEFQAAPSSLPGTITSILLNPPPSPPPKLEAVTSAELQPSAEAAS